MGESRDVYVEDILVRRKAAEALDATGIEKVTAGDRHTRKPLSITSPVNPSVSYWFGNGLEYKEVVSAMHALQWYKYNNKSPKALIYALPEVGSKRSYGVVTEHAMLAALLVSGRPIGDDVTVEISDPVMVDKLSALDDSIEEQWNYWDEEGTTGDVEYINHYDDTYDLLFDGTKYADVYFQSKAGLHGLDVGEQLESLMSVLGFDYRHNKGCSAGDYPQIREIERQYQAAISFNEPELDAVLMAGEVSWSVFESDNYSPENVVPCEVRSDIGEESFLTSANLLARALVKGMGTGVIEVPGYELNSQLESPIVRKIEIASKTVSLLRERLEFNVAAVLSDPFDPDQMCNFPRGDRQGSTQIFACGLLRGALGEMKETGPALLPEVDKFWEMGVRQTNARRKELNVPSQALSAQMGVEL